MSQTKFRMGRLDHVHIRVPDREVAAQWYADYLGFEAVEKYEFWANEIEGGPLQINDVVDFDMCWAYNLVDPWGNNFELNCYEYDRIKTDLIEADGVEPVRYWPRSLYEQYKK